MKKIRYLFILIFIISISIIGFQMVDKIRADKINQKVREIYKEDINIEEVKNINEDDKDKYKFKAPQNLILDEFKPLLEENKKTVGWLKINNTNIDYPVVQGEDNEFYLNHDFYDNYNAHGSIYMDFRNRKDLRDKHTIIYGHHIKNGSMFHDLVLYKDDEFYQENKVFTFKTLYGQEKYEIFSTHIYENNPYIIKTRFNNDEFDKFISELKEISDHDVNIDVNSDDKILSLITCTYEFKDARYVMHAKRID